MEFVSTYPQLVLYALLSLIAVIGWFIRNGIENLNTTMKAIISTQAELNDRLTVQETICQTCRKTCPEAHRG